MFLSGKQISSVTAQQEANFGIVQNRASRTEVQVAQKAS